MIARLIALKLFAALLLLPGCAAPPKVAPHFTAPTVAPVTARVHTAGKSVANAITIVKTIGRECPQAQAQINALNKDLFDVRSELQTLEGVTIPALASEIKTQTDRANKLSGDYDTLHAQNDKAEAIVKRVDAYWGIGAFGYGLERLVRHLLILAAVIAALAVVAWIALMVAGVSMPGIGAAFSAAGAIFGRALAFVRNRFSKPVLPLSPK